MCFMPVQFQTNAEGICKLETSANLPVESISHITWLKNPKHRSPSQHIVLDCKEELPTCAKCGKAHQTMECTAGCTKCMPCRSMDHQTNNKRCPECIDCENTMIDKKPKALTPYYIMDKHWTWGLPNNNLPNCNTDLEHMQHNHRPYVINMCQGCNHPQPRGQTIQQCMLISSSFHCKPVQTGTNNTPLGHKLCVTHPLLHSPHHQASTSNQQASKSQSAQPTKPTNTHQ